MNFLSAVTRVMTANGILRGDTDAPISFSDLQHGATINIARVAIQDELGELLSDLLIPYEKKTTGSITTVAATRSYALATDFVRFFGTPMLYESTSNLELFEYKGGEDALKLAVNNYKTAPGEPFTWYFEAGQTKQISFYAVPTEAKTYTYDYQADVSVTDATDTLPFASEQEAQAFCRLASRRFKLLFEGSDTAALIQDPEHLKAKSTLLAMLSGRNPANSYAPRYQK